MFIKWSLLAFIQIVLMVLNVILTPIMSVYLIWNDNLPKTLSYFQTSDAPAIGDEMFYNKEMAFTHKLPVWLSRYIRGIAWAIRNPAYGFADTAGVVLKNAHDKVLVGPEMVDIGRDEITGLPITYFGKSIRTLTNGDGNKYFEYRHAGKWNNKLAWFIQLGWSLSNDTEDGSIKHLCVYIRPFISIEPEKV